VKTKRPGHTPVLHDGWLAAASGGTTTARPTTLVQLVKDPATSTTSRHVLNQLGSTRKFSFKYQGLDQRLPARESESSGADRLDEPRPQALLRRERLFLRTSLQGIFMFRCTLLALLVTASLSRGEDEPKVTAQRAGRMKQLFNARIHGWDGDPNCGRSRTAWSGRTTRNTRRRDTFLI